MLKVTHEARENWREVDAWSVDTLTATQLTNLILVVLIGIATLMALVLGILKQMTLGEFFSSLTTELIGAGVTFYALELIIRPKVISEDIAKRKEQLIRELGSTVHDVAIKAVEELRSEGWLYDGTLSGSNLAQANLQGADLRKAVINGSALVRANLRRTNWSYADCRDVDFTSSLLIGARFFYSDMTRAKFGQNTVDLSRVLDENNKVIEGNHIGVSAANLAQATLASLDLRDTKIAGANLEMANLAFTDLRGVDMTLVNLKRATLRGTKLEGAKLVRVNLLGVREIESAYFDENTILPNGEHWYKDYDLDRFIDPNHKSFWKIDIINESSNMF